MVVLGCGAEHRVGGDVSEGFDLAVHAEEEDVARGEDIVAVEARVREDKVDLSQMRVSQVRVPTPELRMTLH